MALEKQMDLFQEGGMIDEGGTTDPVSGNDVPTGSLKKEVRDDIPAQLSEGEFVMPADVVRFHGLDKMMALRDEAKSGLQRMEDMGQMGNSEEATIPDGIPFNMDDLELEDEPMEMQVGGFVPGQGFPSIPPGIPTPGQQGQFTPGGMQQSQFAQYQPQFTPYQMPDYTQPTMPAYTPPQQAATPMAPTAVPQFSSFVTPTYVTYVNDAGNTIQIPVGPDGKPLIPVPAGFKKQTDTPDVPDTATPPTTVAPTTVAQPQEDRISPEELAQQQQAQQNIKERKAAAKELGYTKEANPLEGLLGALIPGAALFGVGGNQEAGTIMPDGSIADGKGNTFDPRTGEQLGGKGFLGLGKSVAQEFDMEGADIPEASIAGLRSQAGEQSIQDLLASIPSTDEKAPTDVGVETTQVTAEPATTVTEAAKTEYKGIGTDPLTGDIILPFDGNTAAGILEVGSPEQMLAELSKENPSLPVVRALADLRAQASGQYSNYDEGDVQFAKSALKYFEEEGRIPKEDTPITPTRKTTFAPIDTEGVVEEETRIQQTGVARNQRIQEAAKGHEKNYANKGYSPSKAKSAGLNKAKADEAAKQQRRDRGETEENIAKTSAVTDSNGNPVTSGSDNSIVTSGPQSEDPGPSKIVCTEMYRQTQLDDWKQAIKIWGVYEKKYLTPYHEKGYHWLFMPWVNGMRRSTTLTFIGAYLAMARTQHLKHIMTKGKAPDSIVGNVWCKIVHPIVYVAGRTKEWLKL